MKTVILAGGLGTRLAEETDVRPKPMVKIGGKPMLWHIMSLYGAHGFNEFVLALGHLQEVVKEYFLNFYALQGDLSIDLASGKTEFVHSRPLNWKIHMVDTGASTATGGRLKRLRDWLGNETFMMTYGDGVANVDIKKLVAFHKSHGKLVTVTAVHPHARFGELEMDGDRIRAFAEKPEVPTSWINGGFMVLEPRALDYIDGDDTPWETSPVQRLAADGQLMAFKHEGFWQPMDTLREKRLLEQLWESGEAPWKVW